METWHKPRDPGAARSQKGQEEILLERLQHLHFRLLGPRTVREHTSVVSNHPTVFFVLCTKLSNLLQQPQGTNIPINWITFQVLYFYKNTLKQCSIYDSLLTFYLHGQGGEGHLSPQISGLHHLTPVLSWGLQLCWYSYICFVVSLVADDPILCTFQSLFSVFCCYKAAMPSLIHASLHTWESPCGMLGCSHLVPQKVPRSHVDSLSSLLPAFLPSGIKL